MVPRQKPAPTTTAARLKPAPQAMGDRSEQAPKKMPNLAPFRMNQATPASASLVMGSINKAANDPEASARSLAHALVPAFGIAWNREIIQSPHRDSANKLLLEMRNSPLPRLHYDKLADLFKAANANPYSLIPEWAEWKHLADSFLLYRRFSQDDIANSATFLTGRGVPDPGALAIMDAGAVEVIAGEAPRAGPIRTLRRLARNSMTAVSPIEHLPLPDSGRAADVFKTAAKRCLWPTKRTFPARPIVRKRLNSPLSFEKLGPAGKIGFLKRLKTKSGQVLRFIRGNTQRNLMKQVRGSLPSLLPALK